MRTIEEIRAWHKGNGFQTSNEVELLAHVTRMESELASLRQGVERLRKAALAVLEPIKTQAGYWPVMDRIAEMRAALRETEGLVKL